MGHEVKPAPSRSSHYLCFLQMSEGVVVATGPGRRNLQNGDLIPVSVSEGQKVLLPEYGGTPVKLEDKE